MFCFFFICIHSNKLNILAFSHKLLWSQLGYVLRRGRILSNRGRILKLLLVVQVANKSIEFSSLSHIKSTNPESIQFYKIWGSVLFSRPLFRMHALLLSKIIIPNHIAVVNICNYCNNISRRNQCIILILKVLLCLVILCILP